MDQPLAASAGPAPRIAPYSPEEAAQHGNYLRVSTRCPLDPKNKHASSIVWHSLSGGPRPVWRTRSLAEGEPLDANAARQRAQALAMRYSIPVVLIEPAAPANRRETLTRGAKSP